ncbi:hypothetical protein LAZ67_11000412 [Cordylochernes scorpioides]|uniref:RNase H type-1 domain-containing protein n=1 Tax=Cordylochernes scorpioides TaxID=51811 RepID=A0ABY6L2R0_9ARAC|nr:hypothetical protein LAZ67_11000412 [Cordylochernes scorpioides]
MADINPEEDIHTDKTPQVAGCTDRSDLLHGQDTTTTIFIQYFCLKMIQPSCVKLPLMAEFSMMPILEIRLDGVSDFSLRDSCLDSRGVLLLSPGVSCIPRTLRSACVMFSAMAALGNLVAEIITCQHTQGSETCSKIQLSAARIITGLRNTCPNDIVLYEADIMPLKDRRSYNLPKYINKIKSYENKHRTFNYILNWESNLRLKKEGPLHLAKRNEFLKYRVEKNYLAEKISPCKPLQNVIFNATLNEPTNKQYQNPEYLKQLSLEIINNIPKNAITIYTDGSRDELGHTGSGCLIKTTNGIEKMNRRNPDFCSVFRSELIAIYEALKSIRNTNYQDIWILTDSRSAIQHLSHTGELRDKVSRSIIGYLQKLSKTSKIHLQWIPSHVGIEGNEAADVLAKKRHKRTLATEK